MLYQVTENMCSYLQLILKKNSSFEIPALKAVMLMSCRVKQTKRIILKYIAVDYAECVILHVVSQAAGGSKLPGSCCRYYMATKNQAHQSYREDLPHCPA